MLELPNHALQRLPSFEPFESGSSLPLLFETMPLSYLRQSETCLWWAYRNPPDKTTWGALRKEVKKRRNALVGGFTCSVSFLSWRLLLVQIICTYSAL
jgi:hypothetical protein